MDAIEPADDTERLTKLLTGFRLVDSGWGEP